MEAVIYIKDNLKLIRSIAGLNQLEFGKLIDVSKDIVYTWESGKVVPKNFLLEKIAKIVGVSAPQLLYTKLTIDDLKDYKELVSKNTIPYPTNPTNPTPEVNEPPILTADERKALWDIINAQKELIDRLSKEAKDE